jgi:drug/metabolite transporter (DMT)-like permease
MDRQNSGIGEVTGAIGNRRPWLGSRWVLLAAVVVLWGSSFALMKIAVATVAPLWVMAVRLIISALILAAVLLLTRRRLPGDAKSWLAFAVIAVLGNVIPFFLISWGVQHIASGLSGILMAVMPLGVVALAHFFVADEPLSLRKLAGFVLGFAGVAVVIGLERLTKVGTHGMALWGEIAVTAAALCYAVSSIVSRRAIASGPLEMASAALLIAGASGLALAVVFEPAGMAEVSAGSAAALLVLGIFPTAIATVLFLMLIQTAGASFAAQINYLIPVYAVIAGAFFLGERLETSAFLGLGLILAGIALAQRARAG